MCIRDRFHPSAIYTPTGEAYLVSEAVRGEGAHLLNQQGERFMVGKHELAELAPRDIVAQSIFQQMKEHHEMCIRDSIVALGDQDIDPNDNSLRHDEQSDAQGLYRFARGEYYYSEGERISKTCNMVFLSLIHIYRKLRVYLRLIWPAGI